MAKEATACVKATLPKSFFFTPHISWAGATSTLGDHADGGGGVLECSCREKRGHAHCILCFCYSNMKSVLSMLYFMNMCVQSCLGPFVSTVTSVASLTSMTHELQNAKQVHFDAVETWHYIKESAEVSLSRQSVQPSYVPKHDDEVKRSRAYRRFLLAWLHNSRSYFVDDLHHIQREEMNMNREVVSRATFKRTYDMWLVKKTHPVILYFFLAIG